MIWFLVSAVGLYLGLTWLFAHKYLHPGGKIPLPPPELVEAAIAGVPTWVSPHWERAPVVIVLAHGYGGSRASWGGIGPQLAAKGFGVVIPAMPGQEASPAPMVGFGLAETDLVVEVAAVVRRENPSARLVLMGVSLGGAACWMAADRARPDAIISESVFANLTDGITGFFADIFKVGAYALRPAIKLAEWRTGLDPRDVRPIDHAPRWKGPALLLIAGNDPICPPRVVEQYQEAVPHADVVVFPDARHARAYLANPERYMASVFSFLDGLSADKTITEA